MGTIAIILFVIFLMLILTAFAQTMKNMKSKEYYVFTFRKGKRIKLKYNSFWRAYFKQLEVDLIDWIFVLLTL